MADQPRRSVLKVVMVRTSMLSYLYASLTLLVQGAMTFGEAGQEGARVHDLKDVEAILDVFISHGHTEVSSHPVLMYMVCIELNGSGL